MSKKRLSDVTLIMVDCVNYERARQVFEHTLSQFDFADAKLFTDEARNPGDVLIPKIKSIHEYSEFMIKKLGSLFHTSHCLVIQYDGYIINPESWQDEFLKFDYIGAPWPGCFLRFSQDFNVGNGGFSLRSKKLYDALATLPYPVENNEDVYICQRYRPELESKGIVFAPFEVAENFSVEFGKVKKQFGQHSRPFGSDFTQPKISTIINYCTNDYRYIGPCIESVSSFSEEIIVSHCSHFLNGDPENRDLMDKTIRENPKARFVEFAYDPKLYPKTMYWHNRGRAEAWQALSDKSFDWLLVIDSDEIADPMFGMLVHALLKNTKYDAMRVLSYWYYRDICWQALQHEDSALLMRNRPELSFDFFLNSEKERLGLMKGNIAHAFHINWHGARFPLFHHYSWSRSKEELLRKIKGWNHLGDRGQGWFDLIEREFSREFDEYCKDFVHGYSYKKVKPLPYF